VESNRINSYKKRLVAQQQDGLYRKPPEINTRQGRYVIIDNIRVLNFASNDYLGLGSNAALRHCVAENFFKYGPSSSSSRLVSGNYSIINKAESEYAKYFGYETALFFPSGYQANLGALSALFGSDDTLFFDKHVHASSVKGMTLSGAHLYGYNHNSMAHLQTRLERFYQDNPVVITESLFSMDGDLLDVPSLGRLKKQTGFFCVVDEAHAFGVLGAKGVGLAREVADVAVGTMGKAFGFFGAFILLSSVLKEYLFNFSSPLIYSTTLPEAHAASAIDILEFISQSDDLRVRLHEASVYMKSRLQDNGFQVTGEAHVLAVLIGEETKCVAIGRRLLEKGFFVLPVRYPTVPAHRAILRIGMNALHANKDISRFVDCLKEAYE